MLKQDTISFVTFRSHLT